MNLKKTVEGILVAGNVAVYEIIYQYYNSETSLAVPHLTSAENVPSDCRIFKTLSICLWECRRLNERRCEPKFITMKSKMNVQNKIRKGQI